MNLLDIFERFSDQESCIDYLEGIRWRNKPACPHCGSVSVKRKKEYSEGRVGRWEYEDKRYDRIQIRTIELL